MQIQTATTQTASLAQPQHTQIRKMDGSGNGQGLRDGSNATTATVAPPANSVAPLPQNSTFSKYA